MKYSLTALICIWTLLVHPAKAQESFTIDVSNMPLEQLLTQIGKTYNLHFVYVASALEGLPPVSVRVRNADMEEALDAVFRNLPIRYTVRQNIITLTRTGGARADSPAIALSGIVQDGETGQYVAHATVRLQNSGVGTVTSDAGEFSLTVPVGSDTLYVAAMGYAPGKVRIAGQGPYHIELQPVNRDIDAVVVTGIVDRKLESYTSTTASISGDELRKLTNSNALAALQIVDPAFIIIANNIRGNDPALLPQIELRGKTSLAELTLEGELGEDPNLPLFILDGFESSLDQVVNLDINRIASITLLKDAVSASLYGARSANGVVVVETYQPRSDKFTLQYRSDLGMEIADIGSYNLMDAIEKVEFERLSGRFTAGGMQNQNPAVLSRAYNERRKKALQGQSYDWILVPLQPGLSVNHSLSLAGAVNGLSYAAGGNLRQLSGVMRGTEKKQWGAWGDLTYQRGDWKIISKTFVNGSGLDSSPTNDFSSYVKQSPLYTPLDTGRKLDEIPYRERLGSYQEPNYVYNALLPSRSRTNGQTYQQNLSVVWQPNAQWEVSTKWQWAYHGNTNKEFLSPDDTRFEDTPLAQRGTYTYFKRAESAYQGNAMATWRPFMPDRHRLTVNLRGEIQQLDVGHSGYTLNGFPTGASGFLSEALSDAPPKPLATPSPPTIRRVNGLISGNYVFADRYFVDGTVRLDGSTQFGSAHRHTVFWSAGIGWNVHQEAFSVNQEWISVLRLRLSTGLTGNQQFGSFLSTIVYESDRLGESSGITHGSLGNPFLRWQSTQQTNLGLDLEFWESRVAASVNWYRKTTDPLIGVIDLPLSTGVSRYAMNIGRLDGRGVDGFIRISPIYDRARARLWSIGATFFHGTSEYADLAPELVALNGDLRNNQSLRQYTNGYSPDDIWAVRSLGIDPSTGQEVFIDREGVQTHQYNPADMVVVGNARPFLHGVINTHAQVRDFSFGVYLSYSLGRSLLNEALYEKVENISFEELSANQDRRALYDRWQSYGDRARFRGIGLLEETPISSRFIQRENLLAGESLSMGYTFTAARYPLISALGIHQIHCIAYANNFLRFSNILAERGIEYPFSRTFSLSVNVSW